MSGRAQGIWVDDPENESRGVAEVVSVYFLDENVEDSLYFVGEISYTASIVTPDEEIDFAETTMVRSSETRWLC